jgi:hypothetical protein
MNPQDPMDPQYPQNPHDGGYREIPAETMNGNAWLTPAKLPQTPALDGTPVYDLRPLTTGEVLDRTFSVYRSRFWLFAGIASVSGAVQLGMATAQMVVQHFSLRHRTFGKLDAASLAVLFVTNMIFLMAFSVTQAATAFAVSEVYLGRTTTVADSLRATIRRWLAYIGIALWQMGSLLWVPLLLIAPGFALITLVPGRGAGMTVLGGLLMIVGVLGGGVVGVIFLLRNTMAVPATVVERLTVRASMRRSKVLAAGAKGKLFLVGLISYCLYMIVGVLQAPLMFLTLMALRKGHESIASQAGTLLIGFLGHSVVTPVAMIGFTLVYFDQRVRKEAFDLVVLLGDEQAVVAAAPVASVSAVEPTAAAADRSEGRVDDGAVL